MSIRILALTVAALALAVPSFAADLPMDGRPIVAKVVTVDQAEGRVTIETMHGRVNLEVSQDVAQKLAPGDVVVLRIRDEDVDAPSALPRDLFAPRGTEPRI